MQGYARVCVGVWIGRTAMAWTCWTTYLEYVPSPHTWTRAPRLQVWVSAAIKFSYHNSDPRTQSSFYLVVSFLHPTLSHFCIRANPPGPTNHDGSVGVCFPGADLEG